MPHYKLTYFNVMGLGEPIRFLLSYGGDEFEDIRVMDRESEWPVLEIDGKAFSQTLPICRYLAKPLNLTGKTDLDSLEIDAVAAALHDLRKQVAMFYREEDPVLREKKKEQTLNNVLPFYLNKLEERAKNNGGYFHGGELSYADIFFTAIHDSLANACSVDITEGRPHLKAIRNQVLDIPNIKKWVERRPKLQF